MYNSKINLLSKLCAEATNSIIGQQLAAGILKSGKLITKPCCNIPRNICRGATIGSLHAEANAILNYFGKNLSFDKKKWICTETNKKLDLVVVRVNKQGQTCNARPCYNCLNMMKSVGIRKIYYSVAPDKIICENIKDMVSINSSSITRHLETLNNKMSTNNYYESLLKRNFPNVIKKYNLDNFIDYNLNCILPNYHVKLETIQKNTFVYIYNQNMKLIISSNVII